MASIRKRTNGKWRARYRDPDGKEHAQHFDRKIDGQRWLDEVTADLLTGRYVDPRAGRTTVSAHAARWLASQTFDAATREALESRIRTHVDPHLGDTELRNLRPSTIQAWVRGRQAEVAPSYCRLLLANLSTILAAAVEDGLIASNPCASSAVRAPKPDHERVIPLTVPQVQEVIDGHPDQLRAIPVVGAGCGLRQGEVFGLALDAVDFVSVALAEHLRHSPAFDVTLPWREPGGTQRTASLFFVNRTSGPLSRAYYTHNGWKPAARAAGIQSGRRNGFHSLRHHYASVLLDDGVSIRAVSSYLGHHDPGFTLRTYAHLMPEAEDRTRAAIDAAYGAAADSVRTETGR